MSFRNLINKNVLFLIIHTYFLLFLLRLIKCDNNEKLNIEELENLLNIHEHEILFNNTNVQTRQDLKRFFQNLLQKDIPKNYTFFSMPEKLFFDYFVEYMANSVKETEFSWKNVLKYLTSENIDEQKENALRSYSIDYEKFEKEIISEAEKNKPKYDEFYDDSFEEDEENENKEDLDDGNRDDL